MDTLSQLKNELQEEYQTTRKFFEAYPEGKNDFAPHEKSMKLMPLDPYRGSFRLGRHHAENI
jgi:hypothetical protein